MQTPRVLLVFYSRTRRTRRVAYAIHSALSLRGIDCDVEPLREPRSRRGVVGYARSGFEAWFHRKVKLRPTSFDPKDYDLVIIGTPIWNASVSSPVRTYLRQNARFFKRVAFFLTYGGMAKGRVFSQLQELSAQQPIARLAIRARDCETAYHVKCVEPFADAIAKALRGSAGSRTLRLNVSESAVSP
jgi:menaquinone-dependent protoporphyrinogen IX oxidase